MARSRSVFAACRARTLQLALVVVVERAVRPAFAVAEAEALVQPPRRDVALGDAAVHVVCSALASVLERAAHQLAPDAASAALAHDVQLRQIALERLREDGGPE